MFQTGEKTIQDEGHGLGTHTHKNGPKIGV